MVMNRDKIKFKKLLNEFRSLKYELEYIEDVCREGNEEFESYHREYCKENEIDISTLNKIHRSRVEKIFGINKKSIKKAMDLKEIKKEFDSKDIFRQIARKIHPDKIGNDDPKKKEYEEDFKKVASAIDEGRWGDLFNIAEKN